jgi:DNA polymerase-4
MQRTILHIDMDAFFSSVEQRVNPALRGKPIVVCGANSRTVVLTASYEARAYGVKTGMTLPEARALCSGLIRVESHPERYADVCRRLVAIFEEFTPAVEVYSIDEAFLDLTDCLALFPDAAAIGRLIKDRIRKEMGLTTSIGAAPNKLLAKLASGLEKPDGLVILRHEDVPPLLEKMAVEELCGIGPALAQRLSALGITTCGELGRASLSLLINRFGIIGRRLKAMGLGLDDSPVVPLDAGPSPRSVGHSMTLDRDASNVNDLEPHLLELSTKVGQRLRRNGLSGGAVTLTLRYTDFTTFNRQRRFKRFMNDDLEIHLSALELLKEVRLEMAVRLVGVSVSFLTFQTEQLPLFRDGPRRQRLLETMDRINRRFGDRTLRWGSLLYGPVHRTVLSPAWRPSGVRRYE